MSRERATPMGFGGLFIFTLLSFPLLDAAIPSIPLHPLVFEPGLGSQEFIARGARYSMRLTSGGLEVAAAGTAPLRLSLVGAATVLPEAEDRKTSLSHYYDGNDPKKWRLGVPNYGKVRYKDVYPGVDLVFYGTDRQWEYDFMVAPGADFRAIRIKFDGADKVKLNHQGDLVLGDGVFTQHRPRVHQNSKEIVGAFHIHSDRTVSFSIGSYDAFLPLVIDPVIVYTTYLGGTANDSGNAVALDKDGNILVAGGTVANDFPGPIFGQRPRTRQFAFVTKYAPIAGGKTQVLFTILLGDNSSLGVTIAQAVASDSAGNIIVAGNTSVTGFPTVNATQSNIAGLGTDCSVGGDPRFCLDGFLAKFSPDGRTSLFSTYYGGFGDDTFDAIDVDSQGGIYALGSSDGGSKSLPGTPNSIRVSNAGRNAHLVRFDPAGKVLYDTYMGGNARGIESGRTIAVEKPGVVWIAGQTSSSDFPVTANAFLTDFNATVDSGFLARVDMNLTGAAGLTYSSYFHGNKLSNGSAVGNTNISKLFLDSAGQAVLCGGTFSALSVTPTALMGFGGISAADDASSRSFFAGDGFIARINPALKGSAAGTYVSYVGGTSSDYITSCAQDANGNYLVVGNTHSTAPFLVAGSPLPYKTFMNDTKQRWNMFALRLDPTRAAGLVDTILFGGSNDDFADAMVLDRSGFAYVVGTTTSPQFPVTGGAVQKVYGGDNTTFLGNACCGDAFLSQLDLTRTQVGASGVALDRGDFQFGAPGSVLPLAIGVHMADANGVALPLAGYPISFVADGATVSPSGAFTDGDGLAGAIVKLGSGDGSVVASVTGLTGFPTTHTFRFKAISGTLPKSVAIVSGDMQSGKAGAALAQPLVVELRDTSNAALPLAGITIAFAGKNAALSALTAVTDAQGRASVQVTLGNQPTVPTVTVVAGQLPAVTATFTFAGPVISTAGVTSAATFLAGGVSPGLIATFFGSNLGPAALVVAAAGVDGKFPSTLAETRVLFDGTPAPLVYTSMGQVSAIVPYGVNGKASTLVVMEYQGVASNSISLAVVATQPGLFSANASGKGQGAILNEDNSVNSSSNPVKRQRIIVLFGTGEGATTPAGVDGQLATSVFPKPNLPVTVKIGGLNAEVLYAGAAPTLVAGVLQVNVRVPPGLPDGDATVQLFVGNNQSPTTITVAVKGD